MTDNTAQQAHDLAENAAAKAGDLAENAAAKASELADQARHAVDDTVADAKAALRDLEKSAAPTITTVREFGLETFEKLTAAYKRNPTLVLTVGSAAIVAVATLTGLFSKRR